jgi:hypothetical protein
VILEAILHAVLETAFVSTFKLNTLSILGLTVSTTVVRVSRSPANVKVRLSAQLVPFFYKFSYHGLNIGHMKRGMPYTYLW